MSAEPILALDPRRAIGHAAVLGAGVMGAQIAALLAAVGITVDLFELPGEGAERSAPARRAIEALGETKPPALAEPSCARRIRPANYEDDLDRLREAPLVIEAVVERESVKRDLYARIAPVLAETAILATNTSGIPLHRLAEGMDTARAARFCGLHFFNPPRYMHLLELVPQERVDPAVLDFLEGFATTVLGKGVIRARDTVGFVGNRVGVFAVLSVMHNAERFGLAPDLVDQLTGPGVGRPKSATFRTLDLVGLDVFAHVVETFARCAADDPWHGTYRLPAWVEALVHRGALGQKTGAGVYRKRERVIEVVDMATLEYRPAEARPDPQVAEILRIQDPAAKFQALIHSEHPQARFLAATLADLYHFCAWHLGEIADSAREVDLAMRWGYGWRAGPFESWQAAGWPQVAGYITGRVERGEALAAVALPDWARDPRRRGVHGPQGSWSARLGRDLPRPDHPVYRRQLVPERLLGEPPVPKPTLLQQPGIHLWDLGDRVAVLEFTSYMHSIGSEVIQGVFEALELAERDCRALILWQEEPPFSVGANLMEFLAALEEDGIEAVAPMVERFQRASLRLKHSPLPVVAAVQGMALGGGCEFLLHCDARVAALESYVGLVEAGVGLIPAGGGCKEVALRCEAESHGGDVFPRVRHWFELLGMARTSGSALEARRWGFLRAHEPVVPHARELLYVAKAHALALYEAGYRPPERREDIRVAGATGIANLRAHLANLLRGGFISEHDHEIGVRLATVLCGGEVDPGTRVDEDWILALERRHFLALAQTDKTQARIQHTLTTGKPLRN